MNTAWESYKTGRVPKRIEPRSNEDLAALTEAVGAHDGGQTRQAAIAVAR
jgi:hypothetical protein